jgi:hypothetical protein
MVRVPKRSLAGGEIDPDLHYASDLVPVVAGASLCSNFIVRSKGGVERTPGTEHIATAKTTGPIRLAGFIRSSSAAYLVEYGDSYARLRETDIAAFDPALVELATPWDGTTIKTLQMAQANDVQWIFSGGPVKEIQRSGFAAPYSFDLVDADIKNGPFLDQNSDETLTLTASAVTGATVTLTASTDLFLAQHVGALWRLAEADFSTTVKWENQVTVTLGQQVRFDGNIYECSTAGKTSDSPPGHLEGIQADSTEADAVSWLYLHSGYGLVQIDSVTTARIAVVTVTKRLPDQLAGAGSWKWQEGAWSGVNGYPRTGAIFSRSLWAGNTDLQPYQLWKSAIEGFDDWEPGTDEDSALTRPLMDGSTEGIRWMFAGNSLAIGTDGPEWIARPEAGGDVVRVGKLITEVTTDQGSSDIPGMTLNGALLFIDASKRQLVSSRFSQSQNAWDIEDLSLIAGHMLGVGVVEAKFQRRPWPIYWCLLEDGTFAAMTYRPGQKVLAWHRHNFGGQVESFAILPVEGGRSETLFLAVRRQVGAGEEVHIERMFPRFHPERGQTAEDARCLFAARVYQLGTAQTVFTGLDHLEGQSVVALVDGREHFPVTVTGGQVTLSFPGAHVVIGLAYDSEYETLPFDMGLGDSEQASRNKRVSNLALAMRATMSGRIEMDTRATDMFATGGFALDEAPDLFTGIRKVDAPASEDTGKIKYVNGSVYPATLLSIFPEYEV